MCLKRFEEDESYDMINKEEFEEDIFWDNIYEQFFEIISSDQNFSDIHCDGYYECYESDEEESCKRAFKKMDEIEKKNFINDRMDYFFKSLYCRCTKESKEKLNKIILSKLNFSKYFDTTVDENYKKYEDKIEIKYNLYDNYRINEVLKDKRITNMDEILKYAFDSQKGNKLLIITFFTQKKIENKEFMKELEDNYGIYLDVDVFIKEMNQKLNEIKSYSQMYNYIGCNAFKGKTDLEIIIESYEKAKLKGYIGEHNKQPTLYEDLDDEVQYNRGRGGRSNYRGGRRGRGNY